MHSFLPRCGLILLLKLIVEEAKLKVKVTEWHIKKPPVIIKQPQTIRFRRLGLGHAISTIRSAPIGVCIKDQ